jgi:hypothetical protein
MLCFVCAVLRLKCVELCVKEFDQDEQETCLHGFWYVITNCFSTTYLPFSLS